MKIGILTCARLPELFPYGLLVSDSKAPHQGWLNQMANHCLRIQHEKRVHFYFPKKGAWYSSSPNKNWGLTYVS